MVHEKVPRVYRLWSRRWGGPYFWGSRHIKKIAGSKSYILAICILMMEPDAGLVAEVTLSCVRELLSKRVRQPVNPSTRVSERVGEITRIDDALSSSRHAPRPPRLHRLGDRRNSGCRLAGSRPPGKRSPHPTTTLPPPPLRIAIAASLRFSRVAHFNRR